MSNLTPCFFEGFRDSEVEGSNFSICFLDPQTLKCMRGGGGFQVTCS